MRLFVVILVFWLIVPAAFAEQKGTIQLLCEPGYKAVLDNTKKAKRKRRTRFLEFENVSYGKHFIIYSKDRFIEDTLIVELDSPQMTIDIDQIVSNKVTDKIKPGTKSKKIDYNRNTYEQIMSLPIDSIHSADEINPGNAEFDEFPIMIESFKPEYPRFLKNSGKEGLVTVKALVGPDGLVKEAFAVKSSGYKELDTSAVLTSYKNRFQPGVYQNKRISVWVAYKVKFEVD